MQKTKTHLIITDADINGIPEHIYCRITGASALELDGTKSDDFLQYIQEADCNGATDQFDINFIETETGFTISVPLTLDLEKSLRIVNGYFDLVSTAKTTQQFTVPENVFTYLKTTEYADIADEIQSYNLGTIEQRGADDGTQDYCGTYMICVLETLIYFNN